MANIGQRLTQDMVQEHCYKCGVEFWMPRILYNTARGDKKHSFYCPNGHGQVYSESEADVLRRERDRLMQSVAQRDDQIAVMDRQIIAAKGQITKLRKRASAGTCPCCRRSFTNMARHMKSKHPDFGNPSLSVVA